MTIENCVGNIAIDEIMVGYFCFDKSNLDRKWKNFLLKLIQPRGELPQLKIEFSSCIPIEADNIMK